MDTFYSKQAVKTINRLDSKTKQRIKAAMNGYRMVTQSK